jgi:general stress protein YciG
MVSSCYMSEQKSKAAVELGSKGGKKTLEKHGTDHFSKAGKKGAEKRWGKKLSPIEDDKGLTV